TREALVSAFRILGEGQLSLTKFLLVTDTPRDLRDFQGTLEHILARAEWERDLFVFDHTAMDTLDYTGTALNLGSKGVLLGLGARFTRCEPPGDLFAAGQGVRRHHLSYRPPIAVDARMKPSYPEEVRPDRATVDLVDRRWREYFPQGMAQDPRPSGEPV